MHGRVFVVVVSLVGLASLGAHAAPSCHAASAAQTRPLIELYTSEGCDSCPPADRWLASAFGPAVDAPRAVAVAFHVDYWDRLGWVDRFARPEYTARQHDAMRANGASFVYTPQVLLQGRDFAGWRGGESAAAIAAAARKPARAGIDVTATPGPRDVAVEVHARVGEAALARDAKLFVAYVDSGLVSEVKAGENRGARLAHDRVVRAFSTAGTADAAGRIDSRVTLARPAEAGSAPAVVAFVQREGDGDVLQALALPLDRCASP